jgi:hypothetical protein
MISPISSGQNTYAASAAAPKAPPPQPKKEPQQDTVQLSSKATQSTDADNDGH